MGVRSDLLKKRDPVRYELSDGTNVYIKPLSGKERANYIKKIKEFENEDYKTSAYIISISLVNEDLSPVFSENEFDEILSLPGGIIDEIVSNALDANGLKSEAVEKEIKN